MYRFALYPTLLWNMCIRIGMVLVLSIKVIAYHNSKCAYMFLVSCLAFGLASVS